MADLRLSVMCRDWREYTRVQRVHTTTNGTEILSVENNPLARNENMFGEIEAMSRASDNRSRTLSTGPMQQLLFNSSDLISNNSSAGKQAAAASRTGDAIYTSKSENGQGIFLIRMTQPKGEVPLLVVSNEEGKSHSMDLRSLTCVNGSQLGCGILLPVGAQQGSPGSSSGGTHFISVHPSHTLTFQAAVNSCKGAEKQNVLGVQSTAIKTNSSTAEIFLMQSAALTTKDSSTKERPTDKKVHLCDVEGCGRSFSTASYLRYHQAVHDGKKSLPCPEEGCDRSFSWPAHLKYHLLTHSNQRNFKCSHEGCGKMFYTPQQLSVHQRTHTGVKPFVCREPGCDRAFTTAGNLKNHSRVHSGERPYVCSHQNCGKQFAEYSSLKKHKLTHTGEKPYSCEECGKKFSQSGSCSVHIRGHMANQDGRKRRRLRANPDAINQKVVVRRGNVLQYQDVAVSESVVYSQMVGDHVVTVTTQPSDREADNLDLNQGILGVEEVMTSEECIQTDGICDSSSMGANVVVLSQPHDIVSMGGNILNSDLDHEEIAGEGISHHSPESGTNHAIDPMMETDEDSGNESVWVEND